MPAFPHVSPALKRALLICGGSLAALVVFQALATWLVIRVVPEALSTRVAACAQIYGDAELALAHFEQSLVDFHRLENPDCISRTAELTAISYGYTDNGTVALDMPTGFELSSVRMDFQYEVGTALVFAMLAASQLGMLFLAGWIRVDSGRGPRAVGSAAIVGAAGVGMALAWVNQVIVASFTGGWSLNAAAISAALQYQRWLAWVLFVLIAPVVEEFFFRGRLLALFEGAWPVRLIGLVVTSSAFASMHAVSPLMNPGVWLAMALAGGVFGLLFLVSRDWRLSAVAHGAYNGLLLGVGTSV